jgi:acetyl-CoA carboxylase biotin carboxyl carrier protein
MVRLPEKGADEARESDGAPSLSALSQEVKELVRLISSTDISELHLESGQVRITIKRGTAGAVSQLSGGSVYTPPASLPESHSSGILNLIGNRPIHGEEVVAADGEELLVAPMVGTFYSAPAPNEDPYVTEGDPIEPGQIVGIIEAMKMMNEIESEFAGKVKRVLVQNAQPVEYGQPLMIIESDA